MSIMIMFSIPLHFCSVSRQCVTGEEAARWWSSSLSSSSSSLLSSLSLSSSSSSWFLELFTLFTFWLNLNRWHDNVHQPSIKEHQRQKIVFQVFWGFLSRPGLQNSLSTSLFHFGANLQLFPRFLVTEILADLQTCCLWEYFQRFLVTEILPSF